MQVDLATRETVCVKKVRKCLRELIEVILEAAERVGSVAMARRCREELLQRRVVGELVREISLARIYYTAESRRCFCVTHVVVAELGEGSLSGNLLDLGGASRRVVLQVGRQAIHTILLGAAFFCVREQGVLVGHDAALLERCTLGNH